eukprot:TRINITY_DN49158_c0_g1_i1.p1 TRINITY_DN49158_c0_g1~~TRINITY_DN49158_c0_g1_i1.p1  ORF type:complete len:192 (+),score=43.21 TRINITY_DN49158_c0_g1_i1:3-578(+)
MGDDDHGFTDSQLELLTITNMVSNMLSLIGSSFIVISLYCVSRRSSRLHGHSGLLESIHYRLVLWVSQADIVHSLSSMLGNPQDKSVLCYTQGVLSQLSLNTSFCCVLCIAITLWGTFVHEWPLGEPEFDAALINRYRIGVLSFVGVTTLIPFYGDHYGLSLIHISEPTRLLSISYAVFCLKKKKKKKLKI